MRATRHIYLYRPRTPVHNHRPKAALPMGPTCCYPSKYIDKAAEYDIKLAENWREDAQGVMLLVRYPCPFLWGAVFLTSHRLEWSLIGHSGRIPFTVLPKLTDEPARRLGLGQIYQQQASSVRESGAEFSLRRIRDPGTRMGPQILAPDSATAQSTQARAYSSLHDARRIVGGPSAHGQFSSSLWP
jgi:hypothetical protein